VCCCCSWLGGVGQARCEGEIQYGNFWWAFGLDITRLLAHSKKGLNYVRGIISVVGRVAVHKGACRGVQQASQQRQLQGRSRRVDQQRKGKKCGMGTGRSTFGLSWTKTTQTLECSMTFLAQTGEQAHFEKGQPLALLALAPAHSSPPPERPKRHPAATCVIVVFATRKHKRLPSCFFYVLPKSKDRKNRKNHHTTYHSNRNAGLSFACCCAASYLHGLALHPFLLRLLPLLLGCAVWCKSYRSAVLQSYSAVLQSPPFALFPFISIPSPTIKACNPISARPHLIDSLTHHSLPLAPHAHIHTGRRRPVEEGMTSPPRVRRVLTRSKYRDVISFLSIHHPSREPRRARQQDKASSRLSHAHRGRPPLPPSSSSSAFFTASPSSSFSSFSGTDEDDEDFFPPPPVLVRQHAFIVFSSDVDSYLEMRMLRYTGHLMRRQDENPTLTSTAMGGQLDMEAFPYGELSALAPGPPQWGPRLGRILRGL